jgi:hypothetical protein
MTMTMMILSMTTITLNSLIIIVRICGHLCKMYYVHVCKNKKCSIR